MSVNIPDWLRDKAAKRWHHKKPGDLSYAQFYEGSQYIDQFIFHEEAFAAGYRAAQRDGKRPTRPAKKG